MKSTCGTSCAVFLTVQGGEWGSGGDEEKNKT